MGKEIVFDYSKTAGFISEEEMKNMKHTVMGAKDVLTAKSGAGNDYLDGSISRLIMIKMSLQELRKRRRRFREIPMYFL